VEKEGKELARKVYRFAQDNAEVFKTLQETAPRPEWLNDRVCDNWSTLFTIAQLAGDEWLRKALNAAKALSNVAEDGDRAERLIHDVRQIFTDKGYPEAIQSGDLIQALNGLESSPWGDYNKGKGITTHKVAAMFKPFGVRPHQERDSSGEKIRGYWLKDLQETFKRYPTPSGLGQLGQPNNAGGSSDFQSGTEKESCPTSESPETLISTGLSHLSHSERGDNQTDPNGDDIEFIEP
jgi:putative DNA primase/helicase